ncbi:unnamed protein product [Protopolystoma xenopodis]|uniref:Uncharacterized protein n=1 Tax=Protopolystoma xenopodis TaxID=117903 RepID=A0A3S5FF34_9PLAT|nr:unnamed protein product [Protopolystoma xenopodis]
MFDGCNNLTTSSSNQVTAGRHMSVGRRIGRTVDAERLAKVLETVSCPIQYLVTAWEWKSDRRLGLNAIIINVLCRNGNGDFRMATVKLFAAGSDSNASHRCFSCFH